MVDIITRASKGAPLTNAEMDQNLDSLRNAVDAKAASVHGHNIQDVTNLQSTLDTKAASDHTHPEVTVSVAGLMSSADKNKLNGIAAGATVNSTDSALRDRSTHTGVQNISTISGLADALDAKVDTSIVGFANGVASLDASGKVPQAQIPVIPSPVESVAGKTGVVTLVPADITGLDAALASKANDSVTFTDAAGTPTLPDTAAAPVASRLQVLRNNVKQAFADIVTKQATLVSGTNIKTVGGVSLLGSGDIMGGGSLPVTSISTNTTAVKTNAYMATASVTLTLPASPAVNDEVGFINASGTMTCVVARNGALLMGLAEDMTVNNANVGFTLVYTGATKGWWIR